MTALPWRMYNSHSQHQYSTVKGQGILPHVSSVSLRSIVSQEVTDASQVSSWRTCHGALMV